MRQHITTNSLFSVQYENIKIDENLRSLDSFIIYSTHVSFVFVGLSGPKCLTW